MIIDKNKNILIDIVKLYTFSVLKQEKKMLSIINRIMPFLENVLSTNDDYYELLDANNQELARKLRIETLFSRSYNLLTSLLKEIDVESIDNEELKVKFSQIILLGMQMFDKIKSLIEDSKRILEARKNVINEDSDDFKSFIIDVVKISESEKEKGKSYKSVKEMFDAI